MKIIESRQYIDVLAEIKGRIREAQLSALRTVNRELISLYWDIGRLIVEKQKREKWGDSIIENIAKDLQITFPGIKGFSSRNIWYMKIFYANYHGKGKLQTLSAEISWSHNIAILTKCNDDNEREFYIRMARKYSWSYRVLLNRIENQTYEKTFLNQTNFDTTLPADIKNQAKLVVKDEYSFDFLELGDDHSERQLENAITVNVDRFLQEMGGVFAYIGRQYRLEIDEKEYYIDILLYHRYLKCLVAIELKRDEFIPEYVGKMQFYLAALDHEVKLAGENPSIGIILCKSKKKTTVEYTLKDSHKPIGVASYATVKKLPKELKEQLPSLEQIEKLIDEIG
jgi:predicted nuclease of restriction endonuclease-like (RecB) superfamily